MRHTFISWAITTPEVSMFEVAKIAGTSALMIERTYGHLLRGHQDRWRTALDPFDQSFGHLSDRQLTAPTVNPAACRRFGGARSGGRAS